MGLESATYVSDLVNTNPVGGDPVSQGDDHLRLLKATLQSTFPNASKIFRFPTGVAEKTADYSVVAPTDSGLIIPVNATTGAKTITCPTTSLLDGMFFFVVKTDATLNAVSVAATATINGETTLALQRQGESALVFYNTVAAKWYASIVRQPYMVPTTLSGNYTLLAADDKRLFRVDATAAARTITLPNTFISGFGFVVSRIDGTVANAITLDATTGGQINGANTLTLTFQYEMVHVFWNGSTWTASKVSLTGITNSQLANMDSQRFKGRDSSGSGVPEDLTPLQAIEIIKDDSSALAVFRGMLGFPSTAVLSYYASGGATHGSSITTAWDTLIPIRNYGYIDFHYKSWTRTAGSVFLEYSVDNGVTWYSLGTLASAGDYSGLVRTTFGRLTAIVINSVPFSILHGFTGVSTGNLVAVASGTATLRLRLNGHGAVTEYAVTVVDLG